MLVHPVGKYPKEKKVTDFFKNPQAKVKTADLKKLLGTYKDEKGEVEIIIEEKQLYAKLGDYKERFDPYNATEFEGEYLRAARFILTKEGKPEKVEILMTSDDIIELVYQKEETNKN